MASFGMTVEDLGACIRLIDVMTRNLPALGIERNHFDSVFIEEIDTVRRIRLGQGTSEPSGPARRRYTLLVSDIADSAVADLERLAGTKLNEVGGKMPAQQTVSINELLESVLLVREPRPVAANGLMLALLGSDPAHVDLARWHAELGRLGCRGMRIGCLATNGEDLGIPYLIEVAKPPPSFVPPAEWAASRGLAFYRLRPESSCPFYVEWGYAHPVRELTRLYRIGDERLVLMAADALDRTRGQPGQAQTRVSLKLRANDWRNVFELPDHIEYGIELATELELRSLEAASRTTHISVAVDVRQQPAIGGTAAEVERKIAWHQEAIEQLRHDHQRSEIERQEPVYLVHVFEQLAADPAEGAQTRAERVRALPAGFVRFLDRPYPELASFRYGFFDDPVRPGMGLHVVLDEKAGAYERVMTELASESYVCPQRWWELGVRLFVRAGDTLHPYVEDEALLMRLGDEMWGAGDFDREHPVLLRRRIGDGGAPPLAQAICLSGLRPLLDPDVFRLLSTRFDPRVPEFHVGTRDDMLAAQSASVHTLSDLAETLEKGVEAAIVERVNAVETTWKEADGRLHKVETRLAAHVAAAAEIERLLDHHSESWESFVQNVLEADRALSHRKVEALDKYEAAHEQRGDAAGLFQRGLVAVKERLEQDRAALAAHRTTVAEQESVLARLERELPIEIGSLDNAGRQLGTRMEEFHARQRRCLEEERSKIASLTKKLAEIAQEKGMLEQELSAAAALQASEMRQREQLILLKETFEGERKIWGAERITRTTPLTDDFLQWLEQEVRNRGAAAARPGAQLLKWLTWRNRGGGRR
jgi:hypothetical protein